MHSNTGSHSVTVATHSLALVHVELGTWTVFRHHCPCISPFSNHDPITTASQQDTTRSPPGSTHAQILLEAQQIAKGRIGRVYHGYFHDLSGGAINSLSLCDTRVVVKLVAPNARINGKRLYPKEQERRDILADLAIEASVYSLLRSIQGEVVPHCYGFYKNDVAGCLILEDCGLALNFPYRRLDLQERHAIFNLEKKLHAAGVSHGDFARRNFVKGPRGIRLIDFDKAVPHRCQGFEESSPFDAGFPKNAVGACPELCKLFAALGLLPMERYSRREQRAYEPWDGDPW